MPLAWLALSVAVAACSASASPSVVPTVALTEAEAVEAAISADGRSGMTAIQADSGPAGELLTRYSIDWAEVPSNGTWVWFVNLSDGGPPLGAEGSWVVLDYLDGRIYGLQRWIS